MLLDMMIQVEQVCLMCDCLNQIFVEVMGQKIEKIEVDIQCDFWLNM